MVAGMFRRWSVLLVTMLAAFHPAVASAQGRGWRWFQSCSTPTTMVLEARLDSASAFRTTFPACFLDKAPWNTKVLRFHFTPGRTVEWPNASVWRDGDERRFAATTSVGRTLVAQIYERGTNTSGSILGIAIGTKDSVTPLDTVLWRGDRKSTRLNSSHDQISYAVFCLKKKKKKIKITNVNKHKVSRRKEPQRLPNVTPGLCGLTPLLGTHMSTRITGYCSHLS